jgi:putative ABC transport system permease protein
VSGNPATALNEPKKAVLTALTAQRYFGNSNNPIGQLIRLDNKEDVEVVGVVKDVPQTNHLPFSMIVSYSKLNKSFMNGLDINRWGFTGSGYCYMRLQDPTSRPHAEHALADMVQKNIASENNKNSRFFLQPIRQIHFDPQFEDSNPSYTVSAKYLTMLLLLGGFIILIACINYINLSTAFAFTKSKEIGI